MPLTRAGMKVPMVESINVTEFIRLFTSHEMRLRAFAFSVIPHWADAEEVLQEASVILWQKFDQFTPGSSFFSWACKIVHLTAKDYRRRRQRERQRVCFTDEFLDLIAEELDVSHETLVERERVLAECVTKLKERQMQMLHLRYQENLGVQDVADRMGATAKAIYQALSRTHQALFECVERGLRARGFQ